jgi:O-antigen/teichoic acid export membrane protein
MIDGATRAPGTVSTVGGAVDSHDDRVRRVSSDLLVRSGPAASSPSVPPRGILGALRNPLLRNGYLLAFSTGSTAAVGLLFWTVAAWKYSPFAVGCSAAAVSLMRLASEVAELNLGHGAMVRFVPSAGQQARRLVAGAHLVCGCIALLVGIGCVVVVPIISPGSKFLHGLLPAAMFVVAVTAYPLSVIQDGVLVGLRRAALVPVKNLAVAVVKLALVVMLAGVMPAHGIFASWVLALIAVDTVVGVYLFGWAFRGHQRRERGAPAETLPVRQIARFVAADYAGTVCSTAAANLLPLMVITVFGAEQNAYFGVAFMLAYSLHLVNVAMGTSLLAETARDPARLAQSIRQVIAHTAKLQVPVVTLMMLAAPALLGVFGAGYRSATDTLRLLTLATLPHLLVMTALSSARAQRRLRLLVLIPAALCAMLLPLGWLLVNLVGPFGLGWAWLITWSVLAGFLLIRRDLWLSLDSRTISPPARARNGVALHMPIPMIVLRLFTALRVRRFADRAGARARTRRRPWPVGERR